MQRVPKGFWERFLPLLGEGNQQEQAKLLGVSQPTIGRWRRRERVPDLVSLATICRVYGKSADELLGVQQSPAMPAAPEAGAQNGEAETLEARVRAALSAMLSDGSVPGPSGKKLEDLDRRVRRLEKVKKPK